ncbi:MAG: guanylate kinase [Alphaproteobacteria bacterium]
MSNSASEIDLPRRGLMLVLSSPSGAGKTTLTRRLLEGDAGVRLSISVTTRPPRPAEEEGVHYFFRSTEEFGIMVNKGELLEHAKVFGHYYGTPRVAVEQALETGIDVVFDVDWQGTQQLKQKAHDDLASIFVLPPSMRALEQRLRARGQDRGDIIAERMARAADEISHWAEYDYIIVNDDIDRAEAEVRSILQAERLKRHRRTGLVDFVRRLSQGM